MAGIGLVKESFYRAKRKIASWASRRTFWGSGLRVATSGRLMMDDFVVMHWGVPQYCSAQCVRHAMRRGFGVDRHSRAAAAALGSRPRLDDIAARRLV